MVTIKLFAFSFQENILNARKFCGCHYAVLYAGGLLANASELLLPLFIP